MTHELPTAASKSDYRFEVAISFAGDNKRDKVREVAKLLREKLGDGKVFFDEWFEAKLAGNDAQIVLQKIYGEKTRLVVACICEGYNDKPWPQEEWRAIQAFERTLRDAGTNNVRRMRFLPLRFGDGETDGLFPTAIVPDVRDRSPQQIADLILERLDHARRGDDQTDVERATTPPRQVTIRMDLDRSEFNELVQRSFVRELASLLGTSPERIIIDELRPGCVIAVLRFDDEDAFNRFVAMQSDRDQRVAEFRNAWKITSVEFAGAVASEVGGSGSARALISTAIKDIERILGQFTQREFLQRLADIVNVIQTGADQDLSLRPILAEKLVNDCRIDKLIPKLVPLKDAFPGQRQHLSDLMTHLLPCGYDPDQVMRLREQWSGERFCFFSVPTKTVAECVMAGFDGKPVNMVLSGHESWGAAALSLSDEPPAEGPDAHFTDAANMLRDMIAERSVAELEFAGTRLSTDVTAQISAYAKILSSKLETRRLRNYERTTYGLVTIPPDPDEAHLRRMVLGQIFAEVNRNRDEPVLMFGQLVTPEGKEGIIHRDMESHVQFLLDLPSAPR